MRLVHAIEQSEGVHIVVLVETGILRCKEVVNGVLGAGPNHGALEGGGQKRAAPVGGAVGSEAARVGQHHERRQIVGQIAKAVADPGAHAGETGQHEAGVLHERGGAVDVGLRDHRMQKGHVIHAAGQVRHEAAHPLAGFAVLFPIPRAFHAGARDALEQFDLAARVERLAVALNQLRFVVEGVQLAGGAGHEHLHDALGLGLVVQTAVEIGPALTEGLRRVGGEKAVAAEEVGEGDAAETAAGLPEETTAIYEFWNHRLNSGSGFSKWARFIACAHLRLPLDQARNKATISR